MADPRPASRSEPGPGFRTALLRALGSAAAVIGLVAAAFWAIGTTGDDPAELATSPEDEQPAASEPDDPDHGASDDNGSDDPADDADASDPQPDPPDPGADDDPAEGDGPDPDPGDGEGEGNGSDDEPAPIQPPADRIDPATISVQVLDGYQADGGAAAREVATLLRDAGYNLIAENPALRYEVTTVLWTGDNEPAARQVAAELGAPEARQQSGNLSQQVMVHVVVGADRG